MESTKTGTFCPIPWLFQAARNNGDLRICCQANVSENRGILRDEEGRAFNAKEGRLDEARNAPLMKDVRQNMLKSQWSKECIRCQEEEAAGLNSRRTYELENWSLSFEEAKKVTSEDGTLDLKASPVRYYDLRFGNKCNLSCRMCGPSDSDLWYGDHVALTGRDFYHDSHGKVELQQKGSTWIDKNKSYAWYEEDIFWESLKKYKTSLQHIYMAGGEPLLIKKHYKFLEDCVAQGYSKNIILEYNTNLTLLPDRVIELWKQFKQVRVGASIDGYGEVFEFQRYPGKWETIYKNLQKLDQLEKPILSWMAYTVTVYNIMHLPEFIRWKVEESRFQRINSTRKRPVVTHHMAHKPEHLNVRVLSRPQKEAVKKRFEEFKSYYRTNFTDVHKENAISILESVEKYMDSKDNSAADFEYLAKFSNRMDEIRGQNSEKFLP